MNSFDHLHITKAKAICYSGFRNGQMPEVRYPIYQEVNEDLSLLATHWKYLRLYDVDRHAEQVLQVIENEGYDFKVMLGAFVNAEINNPNCPWGGEYPAEQLKSNAETNQKRIDKLITLANKYKDIVFSVSVGNEACVDWTDHLILEDRIIEFVKQVKQAIHQPVTFCENYIPWLQKLDKLAAEVDFISMHTYPVWENKSIHEGLAYSQENFYAVQAKYPDKPVVITEAGWATKSNGRGIHPDNVNEVNQKTYFEELMEWSDRENVLTFFFEAFDENWKGSTDELEPEKHWGVYFTDRTEKLVIKHLKKNTHTNTAYNKSNHL